MGYHERKFAKCEHLQSKQIKTVGLQASVLPIIIVAPFQSQTEVVLHTMNRPRALPDK